LQQDLTIARVWIDHALKVFLHNKNLLKTVGLAGRMVFFPRKVSTDPEDSGTDFWIFF
jgi:hypothetical protein